MFDLLSPPEFVFARFAWAILVFAKDFITSTTRSPKLLKTFDPVMETSTTRTWRAAEADMKFGGTQKSTSRKAKKCAQEVDDDGVGYTDSEDDKDAGDSEDEMTRGRSRKRRLPVGARESEWGWVYEPLAASNVREIAV